MLISHRKRFIYFKTAKTGGTSVDVFLKSIVFLKENGLNLREERNMKARLALLATVGEI